MVGNLGSLNAPVQPTFYAYDALGNLTTVTQGVQTRTFVYNSLWRLVKAIDGESKSLCLPRVKQLSSFMTHQVKCWRSIRP